ncbi:ABC-2 type transport system permease protein [Cytobacillus eiseniae]|uniref:ABC-2 type transport system permease protein n=2 Tax=Cytobacillus eiseniae TaxID=762947 RepID=A0ABS4RGC5_9BACI|nr:ABC-2 type transport system permease protein [Cytobacillus eiseniae]
MSSWQLFRNRFLSDRKYQYGVFRSIADWTIIVYLFIPAFLFLIIRYGSWWMELPSWIESIPFALLFMLTYLLTWNGSIRTYVEEADKVFLIKKQSLFFGMKKWGYLYSLFSQSLGTASIFVILLPFLRNYYGMNWMEISSLLFFFIALKALIMLIKLYFKKIEKKFKRVVLSILMFVVLSSFSQLIYFFWAQGALILVCLCGMILLIISIYFSLKAIQKLSTIDHEIDMGRADKTKNIELIFMFSNEMEKPVISKRTKPFFFRRSKRIFKKRTRVNGFIELFFKVFIRNRSYVMSYFQIISVGTVALVLIPPLWIKLIIFIGFLIMMNSWLSLIWDKVAPSNPLSKKYSKTDFYFTARNRAVMSLFIIAIILLGIFVLCWQSLLAQFGLPFGLFRG